MTWNPFKLDPPLNPKHGFVFNALRLLLALPAWPLGTIHELLKSGVLWIVNSFSRSGPTRLNRLWEGYFIEFWAVSCAYLSICVVLPYVSNPNWVYLSFPFIFLVLRSGDFLNKFLYFNFYLSEKPQRSVARSYTLLIVGFLEAAALFASIHFIIYGQLYTDSRNSQWQDLYFYSLMNMLTIGDSSTGPMNGASLSWFNILKVVQPMFGALYLAFAISRIIDWKSNHSKT